MYNVVCFSFAGGNSFSYNVFKNHLSFDINLITIDYPGRGRRFPEPLLTDLDLLLEDMYQQVRYAIGEPYAFYGHSMGGLVAYCMARRILAYNGRPPDCLFITGCRPPSFAHKESHLHNLPADELIAELRMMQGVPEKILLDKDFMNFYAPILRADFAALASYRHEPCDPLDIPFKVITGSSDKIPAEDVVQWQEATTFDLDFKQLMGGHFFIFDHPQAIAQEMLHCREQWGRKDITFF